MLKVFEKAGFVRQPSEDFDEVSLKLALNDDLHQEIHEE